MDVKSKRNYYVLSVDGKNMAQELTRENGNIYLFVHGNEVSLENLQLRLTAKSFSSGTIMCRLVVTKRFPNYEK